MLEVGITGGIGSGKSLICDIFHTLGVQVYNADFHAKRLMRSDTAIMSAVKKIFGEKAYIKSELNAAYIADSVFKNKTLLNKLNSIVHPVVMKDFEEWGKRFDSHGYVLMESALLFENNLVKYFDKVILVYCPQKIRIQRVVERDNSSRGKVLSRIKNQMDDRGKIKHSDYVIKNDGDKMILSQILNIHNDLKK